MDMRKKLQLSLINSTWLLLLVSLNSCNLVDSDPPFEFSNLSFQYNGTQTGSFMAYPKISDPSGEIILCWSDSSLSIRALYRNAGYKDKDYITIVIKGSTKLFSGQILSSENKSTDVISSSIGFKDPIINEGDAQPFSNEGSKYNMESMTFKLEQFEPTKYGITLRGSFSGSYKNSKGRYLSISNGSVFFPNLFD
jgi:hypothetical protein